MTSEEDLIRIAKKLDKMVSRNNTEGALDLLRELKSFNITLKLLQETRIGMSVNGIRKHCTDEEVIALAKVLIKDWKRLLDSEKSSEMKNGLDSSQTAVSPSSSPSETQSSHRRLDVKPKHDSDPDKTPPDKNRREKHNDEHKNKKRLAEDTRDEKHLEEPKNEKHHQEIRKEKHLEEPQKRKHAEDAPLQVDNNKQKHAQDLPSEKHKPETRKERAEPKKMRHVEEVKKEKHSEKHSYADDMKKDRHREESRHELQRAQGEPLRKKPAFHKPLFERRGVMDGTVLYPTRFPSPPRPARPPLPKRPSVDLKKDRSGLLQRLS